MKRVLFALLALSFSLQAQVSYPYLEFCNKVIQDSDNSIECLHKFYRDLVAYKKDPDFRFRYYDFYSCIVQPEPKYYERAKVETNPFYKPIAAGMWKLYNDMYAKGGEIVVFVRLEDYKTDPEKGFRLIREMQQLQKGIADLHDKLAGKIAADAKTVTTGSYARPYQMFMNAVVHEEALLRKLTENFNEGYYAGFPQEEILKSYLETDDMLTTLKPSNFKVPDNAALKSCFEGIQMLQKMKQSALDNFNNTSTFDGQYANQVYLDMSTHFSNDIIYFFSYMCAQGTTNGKPLSYYPMDTRQYDLDMPAKPWTPKNLEYTPASSDSISIVKQPSPLPVAGFFELNLIINYVNQVVGSMESIYKELRSEEYTWETLRKGKRGYKTQIVKFERFKVPVSVVALINKNSKNILTLYRQPIVQRVDDLQHIMLVMQDKLFKLSLFMRTGPLDEKSADHVDAEVKILEQLYNELDLRKEKLYKEVRKVYAAYPPAKSNSWIVASNVLLKSADDSRRVLRQVELRAYEKNTDPISTTALHDGRRDQITNELKYMKGLEELGKQNGDDPYSPYEYISEYLNTIEEKIQALPVEIKDKNKAYSDILYMHNRIIDRYNQFAEIAFGDNEYGRRDPVRPMYILDNIFQPMKYHYDPPKPEEKKPEPVIVPEVVVEQPQEVITFEGYPFNNIVLLLDVSSSMDTPERLPQLKKGLLQLIKLMRPEDEVSIVVYSGKASVLLPPTSATDTVKIIRSIQELKSSGKTNVADGLNLAYKTARKNFKSDGNNRIILATDGEFNIGEPLYALAEKNAAEIPITVFDFSQRPDPIKPIQALAERGLGNYVKISGDNALQALADEARKQ